MKSNCISLLKNSWRSLWHFIFPPLCLHCEEVVPEEDHYFCASCLQLIDPIYASFSCERCSCHHPGSHCAPWVAPFHHLITCYQKWGCIATLQEQLLKTHSPKLLQMTTQLLLLQLADNRLDFPTAITSIKKSSIDTSLAQSVAKTLKLPYLTSSFKNHVVWMVVLEKGPDVLETGKEILRSHPKSLILLSLI